MSKTLQDALRQATGKPYFDDLKNIVEAIMLDNVERDERVQKDVDRIDATIGRVERKLEPDPKLYRPIDQVVDNGGGVVPNQE